MKIEKERLLKEESTILRSPSPLFEKYKKKYLKQKADEINVQLKTYTDFNLDFYVLPRLYDTVAFNPVLKVIMSACTFAFIGLLAFSFSEGGWGIGTAFLLASFLPLTVATTWSLHLDMLWINKAFAQRYSSCLSDIVAALKEATGANIKLMHDEKDDFWWMEVTR